MQLDAMEVASIIRIGHLIRVLGVFRETSWKPRFLAIPDKPFKVIEGVPGVLLAVIPLLDAMECGPMQELVCVVVLEKLRVLFEVAAVFGIGLESIIEKSL